MRFLPSNLTKAYGIKQGELLRSYISDLSDPTGTKELDIVSWKATMEEAHLTPKVGFGVSLGIMHTSDVSGGQSVS